MPSDFKLRFFDTSGTQIGGELTRNLAGSTPTDVSRSGFLDLAYSTICNDVGVCKFTLPGSHELLASMANNVRVEVWRNFTDPETRQVVIPFYRDWSGLFKDFDPWTHDGSKELVTLVSYSDLWWLRDRHVLWAAETANRSKFSGARAETVLKTLVDYNAGTNAIAVNGRERDGAIPGISIQASAGGGNTIDWSCAYDNLLETLKKIWPIAGGDYDLVKTSQTTWEFRWYAGQLGTDRSATVTFSLEVGNMANPVMRLIRSSEKTVTLVGGQGEGADRQVEIRTGPNYNVSTNNVETFTPATQYTTAAGLQSAGDTELQRLRAVESLDFTVLQTPSCRYGLHYFVGDRVRAKFRQIDKSVKIQSVTVSLAGGKETIDIGLLNV